MFKSANIANIKVLLRRNPNFIVMTTLPSSMYLDTAKLSNIFSSTAASYKFYWFISILQLVDTGTTYLTFHKIVTQMIVNAWYPVNFCHLKLGHADKMTEVIDGLTNTFGFERNETREELIGKLSRATGPLLSHMAKLAGEVPFHFLSPWTGSFRRAGHHQLFANASRDRQNNCPYSISSSNDGIYIDEVWLDYFCRNKKILLDFAFFNLANYIQDRNPEIPGVLYKLAPPSQRNSLKNQHEFWSEFLNKTGRVHSIYTNCDYLQPFDYALDHFIPWSYVAHDQMWNLTPIERSINSSKSNNLPSLELVESLASEHYQLLHFHLQHNERNELIEDYTSLGEPISVLKNLSELQFGCLYDRKMKRLYESASLLGFPEWRPSRELL